MSQSNEQVIRDFLGLWKIGARISAFEQYLADDVEWIHSGLSEGVGKSACLVLAEQHARLFPVVKVDIRSLAANGDVVLTERIDRLMPSDGSASVGVEVAGSFRLQDGKICYWRDYFDPRPFVAPMPRPSA
ncbi:limonene-1,2-epoxide hydrolase [Mycobacterium sp. MAA66]|uniref:limonene-1,2-epoxide hydrolase family protein n=1 Tax=Mycobacterium sp. MAA66 TaxID=3156297 RepID=UPI003511506A